MKNSSVHVLACIVGVSLGFGAPAHGAGPRGEIYALLQSPTTGSEEAEQQRAAWRAAREALRQGQYQQAQTQFEAIIRDHPDSRYVPESYYWRGYALYEMAGQDNLRKAAESLKQVMQKYPEHSSVEEARELLLRVQGQLMNQHADRESAEAIIQFLDEWDKSNESPDKGKRRDDCDELKILAVTSLLQMNEERALPLLRRVIEDHTKCPELREKAIFVASQHDSRESMQLILDAARNDPDRQVRQQAVFWLSQISGDESLDALVEIAHDRSDPEVQLKAVFALSQHGSPRADKTLEELARDSSYPNEVRERAIFWLGQNHGSVDFLSGLYNDLAEPELREKVLFSISQTGTRQAGEWLRQLTLDPQEPRDMREKALFWLGQMGELSCSDMKQLYASFTENEMRQQVLFGLSQMDESCATDTLIEIARAEKDPELLKKAIFWLGQSGDASAVEFLEELINR